KTGGRAPNPRRRRPRPTTSAYGPSPYTAAVSIQFTPSSSAWRMVATDCTSSCGPQPNDQPPPPIAQAPKPTVVISSPLVPSERVGNVMVFSPPPLPDANVARNTPVPSRVTSV